MLEFDITRLVPKFILNDRNGYALAKALEAGLKYCAGVLKAGLDCLNDADTMPEWRLDEMAWELGCLYDYNSGIENKRKWIKNALPYYSILGTPRGIVNYLEGYFDKVQVISSGPYHFTVNVAGELGPEQETWLRYAVEAAKNVRSIFDGIMMTSETPDILLTQMQMKTYIVPMRMCGTFSTGEAEII